MNDRMTGPEAERALVKACEGVMVQCLDPAPRAAAVKALALILGELPSATQHLSLKQDNPAAKARPLPACARALSPAGCYAWSRSDCDGNGSDPQCLWKPGT